MNPTTHLTLITLILSAILTASCNETPISKASEPDTNPEEHDAGLEEHDAGSEEHDASEEALPPPCAPEDTPFHLVYFYAGDATTRRQYTIIEKPDETPLTLIGTSNDGTGEDLKMYYSSPYPVYEMLQGLQKDDIVDAMVAVGDRCSYGVIRNIDGKIIIEGGSRCFRCTGETAAFEEVCSPRIRLDYEAGPTKERCRVVESARENNQECAVQWDAYSMYVRDDNGEYEIFPDQPLNLTVEGEPYLAFSFSGGVMSCPCHTHCPNNRTDFLMVPLESVTP